MTWQFLKPGKWRILFAIVSVGLAIIAAVHSLQLASEDRQLHYENQQVIVYDMHLIAQNTRILADNQIALLHNGTDAKLRDINTRLIENYSELQINPGTGQP